jgi:1-pyrroline dehydrogenase
MTGRNFIAGQWVDSSGDALRAVLNPATEEEIGTAPSSTAQDVDTAVRAARGAQREWRDTTPAERAGALLALADAIEAHADELAGIEQANVGKPATVAAEEPRIAVDTLRYFAGAARVLEGRAAAEYVRGSTSMLRRDPLGVVGCIAPWNYPMSTAVMKIAPALAAGNTVVLKPSELTPLSTLRMAELAAGLLPDGVLNVVTGDGDPVGAEISRHPGIAMVSMTGSPESGRKIAAAAAPTLKRLHLELGGNAPVVVFDDADLDALIETLRVAAFWNSGQECGAASRLLVAEGIRDRLLDRLVPMVESVSVGDPADAADLEVGPLVSAAHRDRVIGLLDRAASDGAQVLTGGGTAGRSTGFFVEPTVVTGVDQRSDIVQREIFGPVVTVQTFADEADALAMANDCAYGLSGSVWTENVGRAMRFARELQFGTAWVNTHLVFFSEMPWGGGGDSGGGRDLSSYALEDHTQTRHVMVAHGQ